MGRSTGRRGSCPSKYYHDISLGQYVVLGDHLDQLVTLRESEHRNLQNVHGINTLVVNELNKSGTFRTGHGLSVADFDMWKRGGRPGRPKEKGSDDPHSFDHFMVILRNSTLTHGQGSVDSGDPGPLFGYRSDTQSRFGAMNGLPFEILKHEYNHLLLGGNNFHSGGGNAAQFQKYFINLQGGWSMMGAAGSSLLTCSGWDRQRLGWRPDGAPHVLNATDAAGNPVNGDLDPMAGDTGIFVIRDFVTTGDVLRIRLPFIPEDRHQQWIWIENHQGWKINGSYTDRFHWEGAGPCVGEVEPGLFMVMQVDREEREDANIYGGHADYLRPMPATGMYDLVLRGDTTFNGCPFGGKIIPYRMDDHRSNPFSGNHEQELPVYDKDNTGKLEARIHWVPSMRVRNGRPQAEVVFFGRQDHAFRMNGNTRLGMGTNPSTANMMTLLTAGPREMHGRAAPNVRTVYMNGISVEMLDMDAQGAAVVQVRTGDTRITENVRWCADTIMLPALRGYDGQSLVLAEKVRAVVDRSATPTRQTAPDTVGRTVWFSDPTVMMISEGASVRMEPNSLLDLRNGAQVHLMPGSRLELQRRARIRITADARLVIHPGAVVTGEERMLDKLRRRGRVVERLDR
jgi:hypothetical protein